MLAGSIAAASLALAGAAAQQFRRHQTTVDPFDPARASALVTTGPNGVTRNPMYVGMAGLLVANAVRTGSWTTLVPVAAWVGFIDRTQIAAEETALVAHFGDEYESYLATVPRWLGPRRAQATKMQNG